MSHATIRKWASLFSLLAPFPLLAMPSFAAAEMVAFSTEMAPGTVVVHTSERRLYLVLPRGQALRYIVGVGRIGWKWAGTSSISGKFIKPNWAPPAALRRRDTTLPQVIASGSPLNPMGAAAMTLSGGQYAIHGTNAPDLIGGFVSHGCIRMLNADISDLYARVEIGTPVVVTQ
jgi:lipoprotein-anchoring transpeptidase ErfK/SrfK